MHLRQEIMPNVYSQENSGNFIFEIEWEPWDCGTVVKLCNLIKNAKRLLCSDNSLLPQSWREAWNLSVDLHCKFASITIRIKVSKEL